MSSNEYALMAKQGDLSAFIKLKASSHSLSYRYAPKPQFGFGFVMSCQKTSTNIAKNGKRVWSGGQVHFEPHHGGTDPIYESTYLARKLGYYKCASSIFILLSS